MSKKTTQITVLLREVIDPAPPARLTTDGFGVEGRGLRYIVNPADMSALEMACALAGELQGEVTTVAVGGSRVEDILRVSYAMGATRAIRVDASGAQDGDAVSQACLMTRIVEILQPDCFVSGTRLADRGNDPVPALASTRLTLPVVSRALGVERGAEGLSVMRKCDKGARQRVEVDLPCTLLFEEEACQPHYPNHNHVLLSLEKTIEVWGGADLGLDFKEIGDGGSLLKKQQYSFPRPNPKRLVTPDAKLPAFDRIIALLSGGIKPRAGVKHEVSAEQTASMLMDIFKQEGVLGQRDGTQR